jgi:hypothetical protein
MKKCKVCNTTQSSQWWSLSGYFGLRGNFCSNCYDKVSHNSYQEPNHPGEYAKILLMLAGEKNA